MRSDLQSALVIITALACAAGCGKANLPSDSRKALKDMGGYGCGFERLSGPEEVWTRMCLTMGQGDEPSTARLELHADDERLADAKLYVITLYHLGERVWDDVAAPEGDVEAGEIRRFMGEVEWSPDKKLMPGGYVVEITRVADDSRTSNFSIMVQ